MSKSLHDPPGSSPKGPDDCRRLRRIIAEDPLWSLALVPSLSHLCLKSFVRDFEGLTVYEQLSNTQRVFIQERLPPSLPLSVTANVIEDGVYWKRCCKQQWHLCDVSHYGDSWKRMFFERRLEGVIELFIPGVTETKKILEMVPLCENYVKRLDISQLLTPIREPKKGKEEEDNFLGLENDDEYDGPLMNHFDFSILLEKLTCLEELHVVYRVKQCGLNYEGRMFEMNYQDCLSLAKALKSCKTLKLLRLHQSNIDDMKVQMLVKQLLGHPSLRELDFSHNVIRDSGAGAVGKLLTKSKLEVLNMCDNEITDPGATAIAHALSKNSTLVSLNLRLNRLRDEGGRAIAEALLNNNTLRHLHLGANEVTGPTAIALAKVIAQNNTLKSINLSCNNLGEDGGKALEEAMSHNTSVTECDIRLSEVDEQIVSSINQVVWTNQGLGKKRIQLE
ncbi:dynein regulatory complex subunit 5 [Hippoglossus stenolepis]|uniref:dynein regulatory complex subunit 5 n=1 Tax=Hippoglossus stenolepis TaxID=195615 RepID=UPI001FAEDA38|nr:dynein regulatory complex subunit 5 [Hippoglossus stenolepis]